MTTFIRQEGLLDEAGIDAIIAEAPTNLLFQRAAAAVPLDQLMMGSWLSRLQAGIKRAA